MDSSIVPRLIGAGVFGSVVGFSSQVGGDIWRDPTKRNYAVMAVVGVILFWIVILHGGPRKI